MNITERKISDIIPYDNNPRNNKKAIEKVAESIREFGFKVPIIVDKGGVIVAGHTRLEAAKILGFETVPVIVADDLTPEQVKAFRLADNKVAEFSTWDFNKLKKELSELGSAFNFEGFGFGGVFDGGFAVAEQTREQPNCNPPLAPVTESNFEDDEGDDFNLPEELVGKDLNIDHIPKIVGSDETSRERVIISYKRDEEAVVMKMLGLGRINKILYNLDEIPAANQLSL